jgi:hypothetical protein
MRQAMPVAHRPQLGEWARASNAQAGQQHAMHAVAFQLLLVGVQT